MNLPELKIINILKDLKEKFNIIGIKAEFEAEGTSFEEAELLNNIIKYAELDLTIKIGGCQAINDLYQAKSLQASAIVAPMIESPYALKKYIHAINTVYSDCNNLQKFYINIETIYGFKQIDNILNIKELSVINGIIFGRTDMAGSLELDKTETDSEIIFNYANILAQKADMHNLEFGIGGNISPASVSVLKNIKSLNKFETRKIIFDAQSALNSNNVKDGILKAIEFEILWLKYKLEYHANLFHKTDASRLNELEQRYIGLV